MSNPLTLNIYPERMRIAQEFLQTLVNRLIQQSENDLDLASTKAREIASRLCDALQREAPASNLIELSDLETLDLKNGKFPYRIIDQSKLLINPAFGSSLKTALVELDDEQINQVAQSFVDNQQLTPRRWCWVENFEQLAFHPDFDTAKLSKDDLIDIEDQGNANEYVARILTAVKDNPDYPTYNPVVALNNLLQLWCADIL